MSLNFCNNQIDKKTLQANKAKPGSKDKMFSEKVRKKKNKKWQKGKKKNLKKKNKGKAQAMANIIRFNTTSKKKRQKQG